MFDIIILHENGSLKRFSLASDYHVMGNKYTKGKSIEIDSNGKVKEKM